MRDKIKKIPGDLQAWSDSFKKLCRDDRAFGVLLVVLVAFLLYQSLLAVQISRLKAIDFQFTSQKKLLDYYTHLIEYKDILVEEVSEKHMAFSAIEERFINHREMPDYFNNLRRLAGLYNLEVVSLNFKPQESIAGYAGRTLLYFQRLPFEVSIKGNYFNLMFLLYKLEQGNPLFDIQSAQIKRVDAAGGEIAIDLKVAVYILSDAE